MCVWHEARILRNTHAGETVVRSVGNRAASVVIIDGDGRRSHTGHRDAIDPLQTLHLELVLD